MDKNEKSFEIIDIKEKDGKAVALLATENNYIVAIGFDKYFNDWEHGYYFNHFGKNKAYCLNKATDFFILKTDKHYMGRARLEELATLFKDGLIEDDEDEALTYFDEICEMTESEKDFFGIDYIKEEGTKIMNNNNTYFINRIDNCCFWCCSILADYSYIVECLGEDDYDKATEIAERELSYWSDPESVYSNFSKEEADEKYNYYTNAGYVEVVENAINDAKIPAHFYVRLED